MTDEKKAGGLSLRGGEILSALVLLAVSAYAWIESASFVTRSGLVQTLSPALFPRILASTLAVASLVLLVRALMRAGDAVQSQVKWGHMGRLVLAVVVMFGQTLIFDELGVFPSAWIGLFLLLLIARVEWRTAFLVATGFLAFLYVFFILILRVPLPTAFLPTLL
jgi:putative tricarboxylic transport membrane protein